MLNLLYVEAYKMIRHKRLWLTALALAVFVLLLQLGFKYQARNPLTQLAKRAEVDVDLMLNAINTSRMIINACYYLFFPLFTVMIFAGQIAGEKNQGTLRCVLSRPVSRSRLYSAKFLVSVGTLLGFMLFFVGITLFFGWLMFGAHEFLTSSLLFEVMKDESRQILSFGDGVYRLFLIALLLTFLLLPPAALAFYCSVICRSGIAAMGTALVIFFASYVFQGLGQAGLLQFFSDIRPYLFTTPMESWMYVFPANIQWGLILPRATVSLVYTVCFFVAGLIHFQYQDVTE